jgi:hypothetical protein
LTRATAAFKADCHLFDGLQDHPDQVGDSPAMARSKNGEIEKRRDRKTEGRQ